MKSKITCAEAESVPVPGFTPLFVKERGELPPDCENVANVSGLAKAAPADANKATTGIRPPLIMPSKITQ